MKRNYLFILAMIVGIVFPFSGNAQMEQDSVEMGPGYANDVFYKFESGVVQTVDRNNWDIAFYTVVWSAGIITNEGSGVELRVYPTADTSGWNSIDTTGLSTWPILYNSADTWEEGAFNRSSTNHPDYGWGVYNTITHNVVGDSIYILSFAEGAPKKLWIKQKMSIQNTYEFTYANLDGSDEVTETLNCNDYTDKNFVYYSMQNQELLDREPASETWDLLFTKYIAILEGGTPYPVTGVLLNDNVPGNRFDEVGPDFDNWSSVPFDSSKVVIGYDWKYFDMTLFNYIVEDSIAFFVRTQQGDVYKLVFNQFDYQTGKFVFTKSLFSPSAVASPGIKDPIRIYPNPSRGMVYLESNEHSAPEEVAVMDLSGRIVQRIQSNGPVTQIDLKNLPAGLYFVRVQAGNQTFTEKLLIQRD